MKQSEIADQNTEQATHRLARLGTGAAILFERLLPRLLPAISILILLAICVWLGLFKPLSATLGGLIVAGFCVAGLLALKPLLSFRWPHRQEIDARLERRNALEHTPLRSQQDVLPEGSSGQEKALWIAHQRWLQNQVPELEAHRPNAGIAPQKRYIAYSALAGLAMSAFVYSSAPQGGSFANVLENPPLAPALKPRIDLWVTPPEYTGLPPVFLQSEDVQTVPHGSLVTLRASMPEKDNNPEPNIALLYDVAGQPTRAIDPEEPGYFTYLLEKSGALTVLLDEESQKQIDFKLIADTPPTIEWAGKIEISRNGAFDLPYRLSDDYGVTRADAKLKFSQAPRVKTAKIEPLYDVPEIGLRAKSGKEPVTNKTRVALGDHPLGGITLEFILEAEDAAGQIASTEPRHFTLPQRRFSNPLAKALVEQRRLLARNKWSKPHVKMLMEALLLHPDATIGDSSAFLGVQTAHTRLRYAVSDEALRDVVDYLWEIALNLEQGQLSDAEKRLQAARDALREALENGASEEEIAELMDEMRQALDNYLQELARQAQENQQNAGEQPPQQGQEMQAQSLQDMLNQIEELARQGARDQAEQLLSQMDQILDNLQAGRHNQQQGDGQQGQMQQRMNELGQIMRDQQQLMDETFRQQQNQQGQEGQEGQQGQNPEGQQGQQGQNQQGQRQEGNQGQAMQRLQQGQQGLQQRLQQFRQALEGMGIDPGNEFGNAEGSMGDAGDSLGRGDSGSATGEQADALDALRKGAGQMMQQMQQAMEGETGGGNPQEAQQRRNGRDPLGRRTGEDGSNFGDNVKVPDEIDMQRAREILNAIRKRLGDSAAPLSEKDYLERLLNFD